MTTTQTNQINQIDDGRARRAHGALLAFVPTRNAHASSYTQCTEVPEVPEATGKRCCQGCGTETEYQALNCPRCNWRMTSTVFADWLKQRKQGRRVRR